MFRWKLMLQTVFGARSEQPKSRYLKKRVQLNVERLEDRTVLSATNPLGEASVASQPPAPSVAAATSYLDSNLSQGMQRLATQQQDLLNAVQVLNQEIAQVVFYAKMELGYFFGINFIASNQLSNATSVTQTNSSTAKGSGTGSGAATTHHESDQPIHSFAQTAGSGKGSGVSPDSGGGAASVYGNVWLDNDGNGAIDNGEQGFSGINVALYVVGSGTALMTTTTDSSGNYSFTVPNLPPPPGAYYYIAVGIPNLDYATIPGYSQINSSGDSAQFALYAGAPPVQINAGIRSMNVTTLQDDPNTPFQDQITLRDAIETGNNGPPTTAVTFQQGLSGSIGLLKPLDPIETSYNIIGPESDPITVDGNGTGTVFTINSGVYSEIDGLLIEGGNSADGGGIDNNGTLTLNADTITDDNAGLDGGGIYDNGILTLDDVTGTNCDAGSSGSGTTGSVGGVSPMAGGAPTGSGGFLYIKAGDVKVLDGGDFSNNKAGKLGGGIANYGDLTLTGVALIRDNIATLGGGIANDKGGKFIIDGAVDITNNNASLYGGGVANTGTFTMTRGSISNNVSNASGGGVSNTSGTMTLSSVSIQGNRATTATGGGIYVVAGKLTLKNDTIGGPTTTVTKSGKSIADKNSASGGGGIFVYGGTVKITGGAITCNSANGIAKPGTFGGNGGGIYNYKGSLTLTGVPVVSNVANASGGGIFNGNSGTVNITGNSKVTDNKAKLYGGGVANSGTFTMKSGYISDNLALIVGGGVTNTTGKLTLSTVGISANNGRTGGGGIYVDAGTVTLKKDFIGPDAQWVRNQAGSGGGMFIEGGTVKITGGTISGNTASLPGKAGTTNGDGGGIYNYMGSLTIKSNANIVDNTAQNQGGGIYLLIGSTTNFIPGSKDCTIQGNKASSNQGVGAYQQFNPPNQATIKNWLPFITVFDNDDTKENNPGRTGRAFQGP